MFIIYTIACCMDGPDLKPKWKYWLGSKLAEYADRLKPIDYCVTGKCKFYKVANYDYARLRLRYGSLKREYDDFKKTMQSLPPIDVTLYDIKTIEQAYILRESELFEARMHEDMAERRGMQMWQLPQMMTVDGIVARTKEKCVNSVIDTVKPFITIKEDRESHYPDIIVRGTLHVGVKRKGLR